jgi:hypothetical protein
MIQQTTIGIRRRHEIIIMRGNVAQYSIYHNKSDFDVNDPDEAEWTSSSDPACCCSCGVVAGSACWPLSFAPPDQPPPPYHLENHLI